MYRSARRKLKLRWGGRKACLKGFSSLLAVSGTFSTKQTVSKPKYPTKQARVGGNSFGTSRRHACSSSRSALMLLVLQLLNARLSSCHSLFIQASFPFALNTKSGLRPIRLYRPRVFPPSTDSKESRLSLVL